MTYNDFPDDNASAEPTQATMVAFLRQAVPTYLRPYWKQYLVIIVTIVLATSFQLTLNIIYAPLIDDVLPTHNARKLALILGVLVTLFVLSSLGDILRDSISARMGASLLRDLRLAMFGHLQELPAGSYARMQTGDIVSRFVNDPNVIESSLTTSLPDGFRNILLAVADMVVLFLLDWRVALLTVIALPLTFIGPQIFANKATSAAYQRKQDEGALSGQVQEHVEAQATVRALDAHGSVIVGFARQLARFKPTIASAALYQRLVIRSSEIGYWFVYLIVIGAGAVEVFRGDLMVGKFMALVAIVIDVVYLVTAISGLTAALVPAVASQQRIDDLMHEASGIRDAPNAVPLPRFSREIRFELVDFSYAGPGGPLNLRQVGFSIPAGHSVAFVGPSGSGKSTVFSLLMRFYDPQGGRALIDGFDLREVSQSSLRSQMGVVLQDTFLFNTTVRENLRLGKPDATNEQVEEAARLAEIHEFVLSLPQGYETVVGERGGRLSGGQRQRLALARALLRDPALLLLDEATSALDPETEQAINATLRRLAATRTRTILSVTHRLAAVSDLDTIFVMDQGRIVECGSHASLLGREGLYCQLWRLQTGFVISSDGQDAQITGARLRAIPLFERLDDKTLDEIAGQFVVERYDAGQVVFSQGDPGDRFYIIVRGKVSVTASDDKAKPVLLAVRQDGDSFGEIALLTNVPRTATVQTIDPCLLLTLHRNQFLKMLETAPALRQAVEQMAASRSLDSIIRSGQRREAVASRLGDLPDGTFSGEESP